MKNVFALNYFLSTTEVQNKGSSWKYSCVVGICDAPKNLPKRRIKIRRASISNYKDRLF